MRRILTFVVSYFIMTQVVYGGPKETAFWGWFSKNDSRLYSFEKDQENIFNEISSELSKIDPDLTFEFGPIGSDGKREFVISGGGIKSAFPQVESLYSSAPQLPKWKYTKFRQRRSPLNDISYGGVDVKVSDVYFNLYKDKGDRIGIIVFMKGYTKDQEDIYANIGFLILDEALGEYDVESKLGFIEFHAINSPYFTNSKNIGELANSIDQIFK